MKTTVLVVDDHKSQRWAFEKALTKEGYNVALAEDGIKAIEQFKKFKPHIIILDLKLPGKNGMEVLKEIGDLNTECQIIMVTAHGDMQNTIEAMKLGAYDFVYKPIDIPQILNLIKKAVASLKKRKSSDSIASEIVKEYEDFKIIGTSAPMQEIYKTIGKISDSNVTVLLSGASGTGKELIAKAIHLNSSRADKPFVAVNCTAIPETLIESEFFGHVKGAFTGAFRNKTGKFEQADKGTLFLDEIGDINLSTQAKLLRVLQERQILPVGGNDSIKIDIRIISATNKPLENLMDEKNFRLDLLHRLKVVTIEAPDLDSRKSDIPGLIKFFVSKSDLVNRDSILISASFIDACIERKWPGNVRELENAVISSLALCRNNLLLPEHLPRLIKKTSLENPPENFEKTIIEKLENLIQNSENNGKIYDNILQKTEKIIISEILTKFDGNQAKTAAILGINRHTLKSKIKKYSIQTDLL